MYDAKKRGTVAKKRPCPSYHREHGARARAQSLRNRPPRSTVKITHKNELEAISDKKVRQARERELADELREHNTALGLAGRYELDDVIDPADTREVVIRFLVSLPPPVPRTGRKRTIDNW